MANIYKYIFRGGQTRELCYLKPAVEETIGHKGCKQAIEVEGASETRTLI